MNDKGILWQTFIPWIIAFGVLVLSFIFAYLVLGKGNSLIDFIKNLFGGV